LFEDDTSRVHHCLSQMIYIGSSIGSESVGLRAGLTETQLALNSTLLVFYPEIRGMEWMVQESSFSQTLYPPSRSRRPCLFWRCSRCRSVRKNAGHRLNGAPPHHEGTPTLLQLAKSTLRHLYQKGSDPITRIANYSSCIREHSNGTFMFDSSQALIGQCCL
jgi:hypothetical protein